MGQSARPGLGMTGRHYVIPSGLFPNLPCNSPPRNKAQLSPGRNGSSRPTIPRSPRQSPAVTLFPSVQSHQRSLTFSCYFCDLSFYTLGLDLLQPYCFLCFWCPPLSLVFLCRNPVWIDELEMEIQLSGYHRCLGCSITMVKGVKDFLYSRFPCTGRYQL